MAVVTICSDSGAQKEKICHYFHFSPFYLLWSDGTACHNLLVFWMLSLKLYLSCCSLTFIKRFFISSLLSAIKVVSSAYLMLLIFLLEILILACASSSPACLMQGDNIQLWRTAFPILNQSIVPCPIWTVASWLAYRFLKRQVGWSGIPICFRIFHSLLWSTQSKASV